VVVGGVEDGEEEGAVGVAEAEAEDVDGSSDRERRETRRVVVVMKS